MHDFTVKSSGLDFAAKSTINLASAMYNATSIARQRMYECIHLTTSSVISESLIAQSFSWLRNAASV